jgi:hypothetical protein
MGKYKIITVVTYCHERHYKWIPFWVSQLNQQIFKNFKVLFIMHNWTDQLHIDTAKNDIAKLSNELLGDVKILQHNSKPIIGDVINFAIHNIDTEYLAHWDVDDPVHPMRLVLQVEHIEKHPELDFIGTRMVGFHGEPSKEMQQLDYYEPNEPNGEVIEHSQIYNCILHKNENCLGHTTMIYKVKSMKDIGGFSLSDVKIDGLSPDFETWKKALRAGYRFHRLPQLCALWRLDSSSMRF